MKRNIRIALTAILTALSSTFSHPMEDLTRTNRGRLRTDVRRFQKEVTLDTLCGAMIDSLTVAGYDKPLRSRNESLFIVNHTPADLQMVVIQITYTDSKGRQLHKAVNRISENIPAGETRLVKFPSWDVQQAFYYRRSPRPSRAVQATPYDVEIKVIEAIARTDNDK